MTVVLEVENSLLREVSFTVAGPWRLFTALPYSPMGLSRHRYLNRLLMKLLRDIYYIIFLRVLQIFLLIV